MLPPTNGHDIVEVSKELAQVCRGGVFKVFVSLFSLFVSSYEL